MHFSCSKKEFSEAVSIIQRAVSSKSSLPALEGILLKANKGTVNLYAYDLELGMQTQVSAVTEKTGEIVLNAKILSDIVRRLPSERLDIQWDDKLHTTITSGASEFLIMGIPASEFPEMPSLSDGTDIDLPQNLLSSMIRQTIFAISADDSKPIHTGSLLEIRPDSVRLVSVDGFRLAIRSEPIQSGYELSVVIPGKTLSEVSKLLDDDSDKTIRMTAGKKHVLFEIGSFSVISRLLEGEFLDYRSVLSGKSTSEVRVKVRDFSESVDRASLLISDRLKSPLRCTFEKNCIKVKCSTSIGRVYDEIPSVLTGEDVEIGFNNRYLMDALRAAECDEVRIALNGPLSPMKIFPVDGENFIFLVLPVRLKSDE